MPRFKHLPVLAAALGLLALVGCCDFEIATKNVPSGTVNQPYSFNLDTKCGDANWHLNSGQLPPGIGIDLKGRIAGTPTLAGTYTFTIDAVSKTNPDTDVISQGYSLIVTEVTPAALQPEFTHRVAPRYDS